MKMKKETEKEEKSKKKRKSLKKIVKKMKKSAKSVLGGKKYRELEKEKKRLAANVAEIVQIGQDLYTAQTKILEDNGIKKEDDLWKKYEHYYLLGEKSFQNVMKKEKMRIVFGRSNELFIEEENKAKQTIKNIKSKKDLTELRKYYIDWVNKVKAEYGDRFDALITVCESTQKQFEATEEQKDEIKKIVGNLTVRVIENQKEKVLTFTNIVERNYTGRMAEVTNLQKNIGENKGKLNKKELEKIKTLPDKFVETYLDIYQQWVRQGKKASKLFKKMWDVYWDNWDNHGELLKGLYKISTLSNLKKWLKKQPAFMLKKSDVYEDLKKCVKTIDDKVKKRRKLDSRDFDEIVKFFTLLVRNCPIVLHNIFKGFANCLSKNQKYTHENDEMEETLENIMMRSKTDSKIKELNKSYKAIVGITVPV